MSLFGDGEKVAGKEGKDELLHGFLAVWMCISTPGAVAFPLWGELIYRKITCPVTLAERSGMIWE